MNVDIAKVCGRIAHFSGYAEPPNLHPCFYNRIAQLPQKSIGEYVKAYEEGIKQAKEQPPCAFPAGLYPYGFDMEGKNAKILKSSIAQFLWENPQFPESVAASHVAFYDVAVDKLLKLAMIHLRSLVVFQKASTRLETVPCANGFYSPIDDTIFTPFQLQNKLNGFGEVFFYLPK